MKTIANRTTTGAYRAAIIALLGFFFWVLLVTGLHLLPAHAGQRARGVSPERQLAHLKDRLHLEDDQINQIRPILEDMAARRETIRERYHSQEQSGRVATREEMQTLRRETEARLAEILTAEQMDAFRALREEQRERRRKRAQP